MLWVAEVGSAHKGVPSLAYEYIRAFSEAGANVLKFQFGWTKEAQEAQGLEYNQVRFVDEWAADLRDWCDDFDVEIMASIWSMDGLRTAQDIQMRKYKIGARMKNKALIDAIYNRSMFVYQSGVNLFCVSEYPTYPNRLKMPEKFDWKQMGYSDHSHGIEACLLAVSRGAKYIEKHVCLDKSDLVTKDTPFSATPTEFETMVKIGNGMRRLIDAGA